MVITPLKPTRFKALVPQEPEPDQNVQIKPNPLTLVVAIDKDMKVKLNLDEFGSVNDTGKLGTRLSQIFEDRKLNHAFATGMENRTDLSDEERIQRTVFVKAPRSIMYGDVVKVIDAIKGAGAKPVGLQIDDLAP
jgi:biopolymer transport protein ExbD